MIAVSWGAATHAGKVRHLNEDSYFAAPPIFVVADGMGGHAAGEFASGLAVEQFRGLAADGTVLEPAAVLDSVARANIAILDAARETEGRAGMGTTLVGLAMVMEDDRSYWFAFNVGDSRLYRCYEGELEQLSVDHSLVQELYDAGAITKAQRREHPRANVVTRVLGTEPPPRPDYWLRSPVPGERFLLCSDGLTAELSDDAIADVLAGGAPPGGTAEITAARLVDLAVGEGGRDNVTAVVVDVRTDGAG